MDLFKKYAAVFGEEPAIMGIGDDIANIEENIRRAIEEKRPLWTFYYDKNPSEDPNVDI
jgi:hypothetical protein